MKENKWLRLLAALTLFLLVTEAGCDNGNSKTDMVTDAKVDTQSDVSIDTKLDTNKTDVQTDTQPPEDTADTLLPKDGIDTNAEDVLNVEDVLDVKPPLDAQDVTQSDAADMTTPAGPAPVVLGTAGNYVILAKSGIDTIPTSAVTGDIGVSPIDSTGITGFSLTLDSSGTFSTSDQVTGHVYAADYTSPTPSNLTTAVSNMETAYTDAAGRATPDFTELGSGEIGGLTLVPGLYKWGTNVLISTDVTLHGGPNDVWIFQIAGGITQASGTKVILTGGAQPKNIFWQVFGAVEIRTTAHFEGIILCQTGIVLETGASVNGRLFAQTSVTMDQSIIVQPAQ